MIELETNMDEVIRANLDRLKSLQDNPDPILRAVAVAVLPELRHRVHVDGLDSNGQQIGVYSPGYMALRTGNFQNSAKVSRGANKGKLKDSGTVSRGERAGANRPKYNRTSDTKVILSLTRQMENDLSVIATENGYGIGYLNSHNYDKALWCEATYHKPILTKLTEGERQLAQKTAVEFLPEYLKQ